MFVDTVVELDWLVLALTECEELETGRVATL
jgi:hypothetical protein